MKASVKPQARVCEYCGRTKAVDKFRQERGGQSVLVWAHLKCFQRARAQTCTVSGDTRTETKEKA